ncbi:MAG TPA: sulfite exporter TauE/SafE family protein [bacterium]
MPQPETWGWLLACAFAAQVIGTMTGFGSATILTPVAALFMDIKLAIAVVACFHFFGNVSRLGLFWRSVDWRIFRLFGLIGIAGSFAGAHVAARLPSAALLFALGAFLLVYVAVSAPVFPWARAGGLRLPATGAVLATGGACSGVIAGLIGTGGAIRSACLLAFGLPAEGYLGTSAAIAAAVDGTRIPVYMAQGLVPLDRVGLLTALVAVAFAGTWAGRWCVRRVSATTLTLMVLMLLAVMGVKFMIDGAAALWGGS